MQGIAVRRIQWTIGLILIVCSLLSAQGQWEPLIENQQDFQKKAMLVLGGWGMVNVVSGSIGTWTTSGQTKYFHQMNLGWGAINTGIAIAGYMGARNLELGDPISISLLNKNLSLSKAFLFNAGLDIGYVMGGLYLKERAKSADKMPERLRGFGNAVMVQGGFLFAFDLVAYVLNNTLTKTIQNASFEVGASDGGIGLFMHF